MPFDPCDHQIRQVVIQAARIIRALQQLPHETNITALYNFAAPMLGVTPMPLSSITANHLPTPHESAQAAPGHPMLKDCPQCGIHFFVLHSLCPTCVQSEHGKYKSKWVCGKLDKQGTLIPGTGCGHEEISEKHWIQWATELDPGFKGGFKTALAITTLTDQGPK